MTLKYKHLIIFFLFTGSINITACKKWEDHNALNNQDLNTTLLAAIAADANLSTFSGFITKTGLDTALGSSKNYTVFAPTNSALQNLDPAIVNDITRLTAFVKNHIAGKEYFIRDAATRTRIPALSGKYNIFEGKKYDDANITTADRYVSNGVLHIIDKPVPVLQNIWEYINSSTATYQQNAFVVSTNYIDRDYSQAIVDSISIITGNPVYRPGTELVSKNGFLEKLYNVKQEAKEYTYFIIANNNWVTESDSLKNYFKTGSTAVTDTVSKWNTLKDLVVEGYLAPTAFPSFILSKNGTTVPLLSSNILESKKLSNGIVYIMKNVDVLTASKFKQFFIQGETPDGFLSDKSGNVSRRIKYDSTNKRTYNDIMISGHGVTSYYAFYRPGDMPSMKYQVYGLGVNDFQSGAFSENIVVKAGIGTASTTLATLAYAVPLSTTAGAYTEKLLGEFTTTGYGPIEIQLTASGTNPLVLDYLRIVPVP